jgi:hypothetical protein
VKVKQNEEKLFAKLSNKKKRPAYPIFKPLSLPDFQIGNEVYQQSIQN